mmetsp:Transcript_19407/g.62300  ORF Transcript_19407/g.62300 Transcript_19407/m.62300 type:complete len:210 (+) Transcript_19407:4661-5290(+)
MEPPEPRKLMVWRRRISSGVVVSENCCRRMRIISAPLSKCWITRAASPSHLWERMRARRASWSGWSWFKSTRRRLPPGVRLRRDWQSEARLVSKSLSSFAFWMLSGLSHFKGLVTLKMSQMCSSSVSMALARALSVALADATFDSTSVMSSKGDAWCGRRGSFRGSGGRGGSACGGSVTFGGGSSRAGGDGRSCSCCRGVSCCWSSSGA